jgi:hypothetical protein
MYPGRKEIIFMALPTPQKGKPMDPRDENQRQRSTIIMKAFPEMGRWTKKLTPGALIGRVMRVGKK